VKPLLFATTNPGKLRELRALVSGLPIEVVSLADRPGAPAVVEDGETFESNAAKKAVAIRDFHHIAALADDSGLCVDALGGAPGVLSARFAGPAPNRDSANNAKLLELLRDTPDPRTAAFRCVLCLAPLGGSPVFAAGECRGVIARKPKGANGFGYDPIFFVYQFGKTFAELTSDEKNQISHRRKAFETLRPHLEAWATAAE
jgi:XTP/dITP diphosphohydrolase